MTDLKQTTTNIIKTFPSQQKCIVEKGGTILDGQKVVKINPIDDDNVEVVTQPGDRFMGKALVLTCGPWINKVLKPSLKIRIPVQVKY